MKVLIAVLALVALARAQQQLIEAFFNEGLLPYNSWQAQVAPNAVINAYGVGPLQQFLAGQQFPGLVQPLAGPPVLPPVPLPFPAQYPYAVPQQAVPQLPVPVPPFNAFQPAQPQFQMVRHGLPYSDAAAVSFSSLHYNSNAQTGVAAGPAAGTVPQAPSAGVNSAKAVPVAPVTAALPSSDKVSVVKDIATFATEYGTGADKAPVARYEAINAGSVHVAPLPGHTVDQKLVAPGTVDQKL